LLTSKAPFGTEEIFMFHVSYKNELIPVKIMYKSCKIHAFQRIPKFVTGLPAR